MRGITRAAVRRRRRGRGRSDASIESVGRGGASRPPRSESGWPPASDDSGRQQRGARTLVIRGTTDQPVSSTRPARTTCPPTTSSTTSTRTWCSSRPARRSRCRRRPSRATSPTRSPLRVHAAERRRLLRRLRPSTPRTSSSRSSATSRSPTRNGASSLLANMKSIEAPDKDTVVFNLAAPDATWPSVLATAVVRDRPVRQLPGRQAPGRRRGDRLRPLHGRAVRARPADRPAGQRRVHRRRPGADQHRDHPVLRQGLGAEAGGRAGRRRHRLPQPLADRPRGPRGAPRASTSSRARARRSATSTSTSTCSRATTTRRSWRSARRSRR